MSELSTPSEPPEQEVVLSVPAGAGTDARAPVGLQVDHSHSDAVVITVAGEVDETSADRFHLAGTIDARWALYCCAGGITEGVVGYGWFRTILVPTAGAAAARWQVLRRSPAREEISMRPAQCPGAFTAHADGTAGECSLGPDCVGGEHTVVVECRAAWPWCGYCLTRRCTAALLVHDTGVAECQLGVGCGGTWHDGVVASCAELGAPEHCCPPT